MKKLLLVIGTLCLVAILSFNTEKEEDLLAMNQPPKVVVCHNSNPIEISITAVTAHLAHGDSIGDCSVMIPDDLPGEDKDEDTETSNIPTGF